MKEKIFIDTDIILDLILKRENFESAATLFSLVEENKIDGYVSSLIFSNLFYILRKNIGIEKTRHLLLKLKKLLNILNVDEKIIIQALESNYKDFEDAIQYYCVINNRIKIIITRNIEDFKNKKDITALRADEYLKIIQD